MAEHVATKSMTLMGKDYKAGQPVPLDKVSAKVRENLIKMRRVAPNSVRVNEK